MSLFPDFTPFDLQVSSNITIHGVYHGAGPALLLLHGFPQTLHIWHRIAPRLTSYYTVIALDLRGYGCSSKPHGSSTHVEYSKSAMAKDCVTVMKSLGYDRFYVCGHDRGARVTHKMCVNHSESVIKAIFLDICPTLSMYEKTDQDFATAYFHWFFLIQPYPFPEKLIGLDPKAWMQTYLCGGLQTGGGDGVFDDRAVKEYLGALDNPETVHGMCEDYRAAASIDLEEARADIAGKKHIKCPLRVICGRKGVIARLFDVEKEWKQVHQTGEVEYFDAESAHYIPEEAPEEVTEHILNFLV